ncbi:hypothetical protein SAMN04488103_102500 [Gemmobacter aquatilis]|uniref:Uncharacterized protein n=1 Tax=Gemmobacter aquatilis TaxID=933059 RepID=A0A1H8CI24_9RHOB|nr:hypothetical protein [Gemmobacter aquatilis]SEM93928.1 hypothetical protein SAMN04488103_102500 [Gemmobacter aquatilis]
MGGTVGQRAAHRRIAAQDGGLGAAGADGLQRRLVPPGGLPQGLAGQGDDRAQPGQMTQQHRKGWHRPQQRAHDQRAGQQRRPGCQCRKGQPDQHAFERIQIRRQPVEPVGRAQAQQGRHPARRDHAEHLRPQQVERAQRGVMAGQPFAIARGGAAEGGQQRRLPPERGLRRQCAGDAAGCRHGCALLRFGLGVGRRALRHGGLYRPGQRRGASGDDRVARDARMNRGTVDLPKAQRRGRLVDGSHGRRAGGVEARAGAIRGLRLPIHALAFGASRRLP